MTHEQIERLAHSFVVEKSTEQANKRVQEITLRLLSDLFQAIEDLDITPDEVWQAVDFFSEAGKQDEMALLAAGLGLERYLDIRMDEAEAKAGITGGTPRTIEGPLHVEGAPESTGYARLDDGSELEQATLLLMQGTVYDTEGKVLPGAKVEIWHANTKGDYSYFDETQPAFNLRRTIITDQDGHYQFRSTIPKGYGCKPGGPTDIMMKLLGRHGQRPAHIHFFVSADGYRKLTTQITIEGDKYLWDDFAFAEREGLLPELKKITDTEKLKESQLEKPCAFIEFDFRLHKDLPAAPPAEVKRKRAKY